MVPIATWKEAHPSVLPAKFATAGVKHISDWLAWASGFKAFLD
jgi:hypothetical protein